MRRDDNVWVGSAGGPLECEIMAHAQVTLLALDSISTCSLTFTQRPLGRCLHLMFVHNACRVEQGNGSPTDTVLDTGNVCFQGPMIPTSSIFY